jgi:hypothetical protein
MNHQLNAVVKPIQRRRQRLSCAVASTKGTLNAFYIPKKNTQNAKNPSGPKKSARNSDKDRLA